HHKTGDHVLCHLCDYRTAPPTRCPACDSGEIRYWGLGTQKLEAEVRARFPNAPLLRMDADTMRARGAHEKALSEFREGKTRILLGTQMIAKGLDFPNVTLVGVIQADTALHLRELLHYPPFASMIRLVIRGESEPLAKEFAQRLGQSVSAALEARQAQARV